ncbi:hypothetical protein D3C85_1781240 [compost metagenome]
MHNEAVRCGAGLAHVAHLGCDGAFNGLIQVGVFEDHERCVAAQFHGGAQDLVSGFADQCLTHRG